MDIDVSSIQGTYTGALRGATHTLNIKSIVNGITKKSKNEEIIDTLKVYIGNNTWLDGNDKTTIENDEYRVDNIYNYYILKKEKN